MKDDPKEKFTVPEEAEHWSITTMREKLIKVDAKVVGSRPEGATLDITSGL